MKKLEKFFENENADKISLFRLFYDQLTSVVTKAGYFII